MNIVQNKTIYLK